MKVLVQLLSLAVLTVWAVEAVRVDSSNEENSVEIYRPNPFWKPRKKHSYILSSIYANECPRATEIEVTSLLSNEVTFMWDSDRLDNINTVCMCYFTGATVNKSTDGCRGSSTAPPTCSHTSLTFSRRVTGLAPFTRYHLCVQTKCTNGVYQNPDCIVVRTAPIAPSSVNNLYAIGVSHSAIHVSWSPPVQLNGRLDGYVVSWNEDGQPLKSVVLSSSHSRSFNITDLEAYRPHSISVQAFNVHEGNRLLSASAALSNIYTWAKAPSAPTLTITKYDPRALKYRFGRPVVLNGPLHGYKLIWCPTQTCDTDNTFTITTTSTADIVLSPLLPWVNYTLRAVAYNILPNKKEAVSPAEVVIVQTMPEPLTLPKKVEISSPDQHTLKVKWQSPEVIEVAPTHYEVMWCNDPIKYCQQIILAANVFEHTINNLLPFTVYTIRVSGLIWFASASYIPGRKFSQTRKTLPGIPSKPRNLKVYEKKSNEVSVQWDEPIEANGPISGYQVMRCVEENCEVIPTNRRDLTASKMFTFTNLKPYTKYTIQVAAFNRWPDGYLNVGHFALVNVTTYPIEPQTIRNLVVRPISSTALNATWDKPEIITGPIDGYNVTWCLYNASTCTNYTQTRNTFHSITGLEPKTTYRAMVNAFTVLNGKILVGPTVSANGKTNPEKPNPPDNVTVLARNSTSLRALWLKPNVTRDPIEGYHISWCQSNSSNCSIFNSAPVIRTKENFYDIIDLEPGTDYIVGVKAFIFFEDKIFFSQATTASGTTHPRILGAPGNLTIEAVNSTTLTVNWTSPVHVSDPITGYQVKWCSSLHINISDCDKRNESTLKRVNNTSLNITHLLPGHSYIIEVKAVYLVKEKELLGLPVTSEGMTNPSKPSDPRNVTVKFIYGNNVTARISWEEPSELNGLLDGYEVSWRVEEDSTLGETKNYDPMVTSLDVSIPVSKGNFTASVGAFNLFRGERLLSTRISVTRGFFNLNGTVV